MKFEKSDWREAACVITCWLATSTICLASSSWFESEPPFKFTLTVMLLFIAWNGCYWVCCWLCIGGDCALEISFIWTS